MIHHDIDAQIRDLVRHEGDLVQRDEELDDPIQPLNLLCVLADLGHEDVLCDGLGRGVEVEAQAAGADSVHVVEVGVGDGVDVDDCYAAAFAV